VDRLNRLSNSSRPPRDDWRTLNGSTEYFAMPSSENPIAVARVVRGPGELHLQRWVAAEPYWVDVPSLYRLLYGEEGGTRVSEDEAMAIIENLRDATT
jgi:hypothetical protein